MLREYPVRYGCEDASPHGGVPRLAQGAEGSCGGGAKIASRLSRLAEGNPGDVKPVGAGLSELRIPHGPGYRVYFVARGEVLVVILCGGDKSTQPRDIERARAIAGRLEE